MRRAVLAVLLLIGSGTGSAESQAYVDFDDHWLAAACAQAPVGGRLPGKVVTTANGFAVEARPGLTTILHCNVKPDLFHNLIQVIAEDNSADGSVKATFYRQNIDTPAAPEEIVSVETIDQAGLQQAEFFFDPPFSDPNEFAYMYFVRIEAVGGSGAPVRVYSVSMRDVL